MGKLPEVMWSPGVAGVKHLAAEDSMCWLEKEESAARWLKFKEFISFASPAEACLR